MSTPQTSEVSVPTGTQSLSTPTIRVLVADDMEDSRYLVRRFLERSGRFTVVAEASNGAQAVELTAIHQPDLALLDLAMPVMDGLEALPLVRQMSPTTTIVVLSNLAREWIADSAHEHLDGVVEKTLDPDAFVRELLSVVAQPANAPADRLYLPNNLTSPREARMFVRRTLSRWDIPHLVNDALLLTSELVANAVLHAESELEVRMAIRGDFLRIEVIDSHPGGLVRRNARLDATSGRGLAMVNSLAVLWGSDPVVDSAGEGAGKSVWFELPVKTEAARD